MKKYYVYEMNMNILNGITIILLVFMVILTRLLGFSFNYTYNELAIITILMMPYLALHELIHATSYILNGANINRVTFGAHLEKGVLCCLCKQNVSKKNILISLVSPFFVIGIITYIIGILISNNLLIALSILNISGCSGDLTMFLAFLKLKNFEYAEYDNPTSFGLYTSNNLSDKKIFGLNYIGMKESLEQKDLKKINVSKTSAILFILMLVLGIILIVI